MKYFFSKKALPNYVVWLITLLPSYIIKVSYLGEEKDATNYFIAEGIIWFILAIILTAGIQFGIDKFVKDQSIGVKALSVIVFAIVATVVFNLVLWPVLDFVFEFFQEEDAGDYGKLATNIFNWFIWFVWFVSITSFDLYRQVKETKIKNAELEANLKASQLNTLKGQINSHFMFNSLNNIRGLMLEDVDKARNMLTNLSETLRYALTKSNADSIALEDELEMVENYVEISKIQFEDRLQFETNIDENSLNTQIPPMIIQMLVENAIKHGISNLKKGGKVSLSIVINDSQLHIEVANTGRLNQSENGTQLGLQNIKKRLKLLFDEAATFSLKEIENQVVATIKIPLK